MSKPNSSFGISYGPLGILRIILQQEYVIDGRMLRLATGLGQATGTHRADTPPNEPIYFRHTGLSCVTGILAYLSIGVFYTACWSILSEKLLWLDFSIAQSSREVFANKPPKT